MSSAITSTSRSSDLPVHGTLGGSSKESLRFTITRAVLRHNSWFGCRCRKDGGVSTGPGPIGASIDPRGSLRLVPEDTQTCARMHRSQTGYARRALSIAQSCFLDLIGYPRIGDSLRSQGRRQHCFDLEWPVERLHSADRSFDMSRT